VLTVVELEEVVKFAKANQLVSIIDNTFTSPYNFRPLDMGFDLSIHSATKYLNGHSDLLAGCVIGGKKWIDEMKKKACSLWQLFGSSCLLFVESWFEDFIITGAEAK